VYYYWWAYLACHAGYQAASRRRDKGQFAKLYRDFGELPEITIFHWHNPSCLGDEFMNWWKERGVELFAEPDCNAVYELRAATMTPNDPAWASVAVPMRQVLTTTKQQVGELLGERVGVNYQPRRRPIGQTVHTRAQYRVETVPRIRALYNYLEAKLLYLKYRIDPKQHRRLAYDLADMTKNYREGIGRSSLYDEDPYRQSSEMSRRKKLADEITAGVGQGLFPVFKRTYKVRPADTSVATLAFAWRSFMPARW
jgi:hypothetical protein